MARPQRAFVCQSCGAAHARWAGRCDDCGAWNSIVEESTSSPAAAAGGKARGRRLELVPLEGSAAPPPRVASGIDELDRVLGGGIVPGAAMLIGGDPGIGKSTLMLQAAAAIAGTGCEVVYVSGEELVDQIRLRALRLGLARAPVRLASATSVGDILATVDQPNGPALLIVDLNPTMWIDGLEQAPGTVTQLRAAAQALIRMAKQRGSALMLIGHVTKDGQIAGPRVLEHMVDAVLYFEGERGHQFRILRAVKNRFGPANEIGAFEMAEAGLVPVPNPSALFLADREEGVAGAAVFAGMEGTRPLLVEIQALVAPSALGTPRRAVVGWDGNRLAMLLAVLEARCGLVMSTRDIYLNVAGGLRVQEPAADLAVAAAIISSELGHAAPPSSVFFGEVGLAGEVRAVGHGEARLKEAAKLGFRKAVMPRTGKDWAVGLEVEELSRLSDLIGVMGGAADAWPRRGVRPMSGMQLTLFDVVVLAVIGLSALAAFTRGAVAEILGLACWVGAAIVAFLALPVATPLIRPVVASEALASGLAVVGVFVVALLVFKLLAGMLSAAIAGSALGPLDKVAGLLFGAARGVVLVCAAYLVGSYLIKPELQPDWIRQAWLIEPVRRGALTLERALPEAYRQDGLGGGPVAEPVTAGQGYTDMQRQALDKLVSPQP